MYLRLSRHGEGVPGKTDVEFFCLEFPSEEREFLAEDLETFFEACDAAERGEDFRKEILSSTLFGTTMTRFRTDPLGSKHVVRVRRGEVEVYFAAEQGENTRKAVAMAEIGRAWFNQLLNAKALPEARPEIRPPTGEGLSLSSIVGEVTGGAFAVEVGVHASSMQGVGYRIGYGLRGKDGWSTGGAWVEGMITTVAQAIDAGKAGKPFSHQSDSGRRGKEDTVFVTANPVTGHAEVMIKFGEGLLEDQPIAFGTFGETELSAIRKHEAAAEVRRKWFEEQKHWFLVPPPKRPS